LLQPGGVLALLGHNGAGKTTCTDHYRLLKPRGEIRLFGEPIEGLSPERISQLGIGLVPQGRRIFSLYGSKPLWWQQRENRR
jgi:branched-chain amino acid transport system ATP-binding protein